MKEIYIDEDMALSIMSGLHHAWCEGVGDDSRDRAVVRAIHEVFPDVVARFAVEGVEFPAAVAVVNKPHLPI